MDEVLTEPASKDQPDSSDKGEKYVCSAYPLTASSSDKTSFDPEPKYHVDYDLTRTNDTVPRSPKHSNINTLLTGSSNMAYLIADTGCQKMVAGPTWHDQRHRDIEPLVTRSRVNHCSFTFGPSEPSFSSESFDYPAGIGRHVILLNISKVAHEAPGLFSRPGFVHLGAVPNLLRGEIHFTALQCTTYLSH